MNITKTIRQRLLESSNLNLNKAKEIASTLEMAQINVTQYSADVNIVASVNESDNKTVSFSTNQTTFSKSAKCYFCGKIPH